MVQNLWHQITGAAIPIIILLIGIAVLVALWIVSRRYKKIPPSKVGIFYGKKSKTKDSQGNTIERGFRVVASGGGIVMPFVEDYRELSTAAFQLPLEEDNIPNKDNVPINARGISTCKISTAPEDLMNAAESFLTRTEEEIHKMVQNILLGHLRSIIGNMSIGDLLRKRDEFNKAVIAESAQELKRLGIQIINLVVQDVSDAEGYIEALGKQAVAEAKRDAEIKVAEAQRDKDIQVSNATKEAETVKAQNAALVAEAQKERDIKVAQFKVETDTKKAEADQALGIATANQQKTLKIKEAERDAAETEARIKVEEKEAERKAAELNASMIKEAEAKRKEMEILAEASRTKATIDAEAAKSVREIQADAAATAAQREAEGKKAAAVLEGEGEAAKTLKIKTAEADGNRAVLVAAADGRKAELVAEAEGKERDLLAVAEGRKQVLFAEAAGKTADAEATEKLAEALKKLDQRGQLLIILRELPGLLDHGGDALAKVGESVFKSVAAPLGSIDKVTILDMGNGNGNGNGMDKFASIVPNTVMKTLAGLKFSGLDLLPLLKKAGINVDQLGEYLSTAGETGNGHTATEPEKKTVVDA